MIPTLIEIGPFEIHSYGLALALSFLIGTQLAIREGARRGLPETRISALCLWVLVLAIIGSRLLYVLSHLDSYAGRWLDTIRLWEGGLTMYGGFVAALVGAFVYVRRHGLPIGQVFDAFSPAIAFGSGLTRIGCFLNGCCFGRPCELPWAMTFDEHSFAGSVYPGLRIHPTQLYLSAAGFANFALLLWLRRRLTRPGQLFLVFLAVESVSRFSIDFLRYYDHEGESVAIAGIDLSLTQIICLGLIALAVAGLVASSRIAGRQPGANPAKD